MLALALSLIGAVGLQLQAPTDLPAPERAQLEAELAAALAAHPVAKSITAETVRYVVDVGTTRLQVLAERVQDGVVIARAAEVGPRDLEQWSPSAHALVEALYGLPPVEPTQVRDAQIVAPAPAPTPVAAPWASWALLGTGAAALAVGVIFAVSSADATAELGRGLVVDPELSELESRSVTHGAVSAGLAVAAVGCAIAGVLLFARE